MTERTVAEILNEVLDTSALAKDIMRRKKPECTMVENEHCARMIIAAKAQAYEEAIRVLEMVERYGLRALEASLIELRGKHAALTK